MTRLTFMNIPRSRYYSILNYARKINIPVGLENGADRFLLVKFERRELTDENDQVLDIEELAVEIRAPVKKDYREKASEVVRNLKRFIFEDNKSDG